MAGRLITSKRGNAMLDTLVILIIIFVMAVSSTYGYYAFNVLNSEIQNDTSLTSETKNVSGELYAKYPSLLDNLFLMAFVLFVIGVIVSVFFIDTHPIFFFVNIVILICAFVVGLLLSNAYDDVMTDSTISSFAQSFPYMIWVMTHMLTLGIVIGFIVLIGLFVKLRG